MSVRSVFELLQHRWLSFWRQGAVRAQVAGTPIQRAGIRPGLYHFLYELAGEPTRFHLRVDRSGNGLLLADASTAVRLRPSGVILVKGLLEGDDNATLCDRLQRSFGKLPADQAQSDIQRVQGLLHSLSEPEGKYPIFNLADPTFSPETARMDLPLSADIPLVEPNQMTRLLARMWELAIPHVTILAGDAPDPDALIRAVQRAEDLGMIAGVRGCGTVLGQGSLVRDLAQAGIDHLDVLYLAADGRLHDSIVGPGDHAQAVRVFQLARENDICPVADIALTRATAAVVDDTILSLKQYDTDNAAVYAIATDAPMVNGTTPDTTLANETADGPLTGDSLVQLAGMMEALADSSGLRVQWYPPVGFQPDISLASHVRSGPRCSGDTAVRIETDGAVVPARGPYRSGGNILADAWQDIDESVAFREYRARVEQDTHCMQCPGLAICTADCPRNRLGWAHGPATSSQETSLSGQASSEEDDDERG